MQVIESPGKTGDSNFDILYDCYWAAFAEIFKLKSVGKLLSQVENLATRLYNGFTLSFPVFPRDSVTCSDIFSQHCLYGTLRVSSLERGRLFNNLSHEVFPSERLCNRTQWVQEMGAKSN